jgi:hypothetical protein
MLSGLIWTQIINMNNSKLSCFSVNHFAVESIHIFTMSTSSAITLLFILAYWKIPDYSKSQLILFLSSDLLLRAIDHRIVLNNITQPSPFVEFEPIC